MKALDRKLLRDLRLLWSQALTIALVVASGIGGFITTLSAVDSLAPRATASMPTAASPTCSPASSARRTALADRLRGIPGVADVQTTVESVVRVTVPGGADPIIGQLIGLDRRARRSG